MQHGARGDADGQSLDCGTTAGRGKRFRFRYHTDFVQQRAVQYTWGKASADPLNAVRTRAVAGQYGAFPRLDPDDADVRPSWLQSARDTGECTARPYTADNEIDHAVGVRPDLLGRSGLVRRRVGGVVELTWDPGTRGACQNALRAGDRTRHPQFGWGQFDLCAQQPQQLAPLYRRTFRHYNDQLVTFCSGNESQGDPGVARGRLDDCCFSSLDLAGLFRRLDHRQPDAVLHRTQRIEKFQLESEVGYEVVGRLQPRQAYQGSSADQVQHTGEHPATRGERSIGR